MTTTSDTTTVTTARTKGGKTVQVAVIPEALVTEEGHIEGTHWRAAEIARGLGCSHYRVVAEDGRLVAVGKAGALPTEEQTMRLYGER